MCSFAHMHSPPRLLFTGYRKQHTNAYTNTHKYIYTDIETNVTGLHWTHSIGRTYYTYTSETIQFHIRIIFTHPMNASICVNVEYWTLALKHFFFSSCKCFSISNYLRALAGNCCQLSVIPFCRIKIQNNKKKFFFFFVQPDFWWCGFSRS